VRRPDLFVDLPATYFTLATCDYTGFFTVIAGGEAKDDGKRLRRAVIAQLAAHRPGKVVLVHEDALEMARACVALWPGPETEAVLRQIESERR
jgi:hypothetical protein